MSKSFTALAVMQLVEAGKIKLDTPVKSYLPDFQMTNKALSDRITVRNLLNQTSGISNVIGLLLCTGSGKETLEDAVVRIQETGISPPPGEKFQYSNANYTILGLLVETVSGESYGDYIEKNIFEPLDMTHSFNSEEKAQANGLSPGYQRWFGMQTASNMPYLQQGILSGYIIASAEDITHFVLAQLNGGVYHDTQVLSAEGIDKMHEPVAKSGNEYYGMGWVIGTSKDEPVLWHHGSTPNYHATMLMKPESKTGVVVLTNVGLYQLWHLGVSSIMADGIISILDGDSPADYGLSIGYRYLITDLCLGLISVWFVISILVLVKRKNHLITDIPQTVLGVSRRIILPIVVDLTWPLLILIAFPAITNIPSWSFWLWYQPDLIWWLIIISSLTLCKAVLRITFSYSVIQSSINRLGKLKFVMTALIVELLFIALFCLVMPLSSGPASFGLGVLILAVLLEIIAIPISVKIESSNR